MATLPQEMTQLTGNDLRPLDAPIDERQYFSSLPEEGLVFESRHRHKNGSIFPVEVSARPVEVDGQRLMLAIIRDITERTRMAAELARQEARFHSIFDHAPVGISLSTDAGCELVNEEHCRITGVSAADSNVPGIFARASHPEDYAKQNEISEPFSKGEVDHFTVEKRYIHPDGSIQWAELTSHRFIDPSTGQKMAVTTLVDTSQRKANELEIQRLTRMYFVISQVDQTLVRAKSRGELFKEVCRVLVEIGRFRIAWIGEINSTTRMIEPVAVQGDEHGYVSNIRISTDAAVPEGQGPTGTALREGRTFVCNDFFADPATVPWRERAAQSNFHSSIALPLRCEDQIMGMLAVYSAEKDFFRLREISLLEETAGDLSFALDVFAGEDKRREADAAVRASESRLQFLMTATPAIIYSLRAGGDYAVTFISPNIHGVLGYSPETIMSDPGFWQACMHPEDAPSAAAALSNLGESVTLARDYRFRHADGSWRWMHDEMRLVRDAQGQPQEYVGYWLDITTAKKAESELRKLSSAVEQNPAVIIITDLHGVIEYVNPRFTEVSGYTLNEARGQNPSFLKSGLTPPSVYEDLWHTITQGGVWRGEIVNRKKNGELYTELTIITPVNDAQGKPTHYVGMKEDITERKNAENALQHNRDRLVKAEQIARLGSWELELGTGQMTWSDEMYRLLELDPHTTKPSVEVWDSFISPEEKEKLNRALADSLVSRKRFFMGNRLTMPDGRVKFIEGTGETEYSPEGRPIRALGTVQDVTERKMVEIELHELVKQLRVLHLVSQALERRDCSFDELLDIVVKWVPTALTYPEDARVIIELDGRHRTAGAEGALLAQLSLPISVNDRQAGQVTVGYVKQHQSSSDEPFFVREHELLENIARTIGLGLGEREAFAAVQRFNTELEDRVAQRTAELAARNSEMQALLLSIPDMVLRLRRDGTLIECQRAKGVTPLASSWLRGGVEFACRHRFRFARCGA